MVWVLIWLVLFYRSNLDRLLDCKLKAEESKHTLILPPPDIYPFSEEDSDDNIVLEEPQNAGEPPLIKVGQTETTKPPLSDLGLTQTPNLHSIK